MRSGFVLGCAAALACAAASPAQQPNQPERGQRAPARLAARWEYVVHAQDELTKLGGGDVQAGLNNLGEDGWELVTVDPGAGPGRQQPRQPRYYFKRSAGPVGGFIGFAGGGAPGAAVMRVGTGRVATRAPEPAADEPPHVIRLKHARAQEVLQVVEQLYGRTPGSRVASDPRTNSLIVIATDKQFATIMQLVKELDVEGPEPAK
jgi:hypothetical protein